MKRDWICFGFWMVLCNSAHAMPFVFSTGSPNGQIAAGSRAPSAGFLAIDAADDFLLPLQTTLKSATFTGLLPSAASAGSISEVVIEIYRVFPLDSINPPAGHVPTRVNSPADVNFASRDSANSSLSFTFSVVNPSFAAGNSVLNGINPFPNQSTGGEGAVAGEEGIFGITFATPIVLPAGHYFFVAKVRLSSGNFYWLSAAKPIVAPGTSFVGDLQAWIRNATLAPDWLRIGTDIVSGTPQYNLTFSISGDDDRIFGDGFGT